MVHPGKARTFDRRRFACERVWPLAIDTELCARQLTAFTLPEQEEFDRSLIPPECDFVLLDLFVDGVAHGFGARLLLFS